VGVARLSTGFFYFSESRKLFNRSISFSASLITFEMVWLYIAGDVEGDDIDFDPDEGIGKGVNGLYKNDLAAHRQ
jgi:hypothetical protein